MKTEQMDLLSFTHRVAIFGPRYPMSAWVRSTLMQEVFGIVEARIAHHPPVLVVSGDESTGVDLVVADTISQEPIRSSCRRVLIRKRYDLYGPRAERVFARKVKNATSPTEVFLFFDRVSGRNKLVEEASSIFEVCDQTRVFYIQIDEASLKVTWVNGAPQRT